MPSCFHCGGPIPVGRSVVCSDDCQRKKDQARRARTSGPRKSSLRNVMKARELYQLKRENYVEPREERPRTRGECINGERPCPWVSCKWHLYLDVSPRTGSLTLNFPGSEVDEMGDSCALDVADREGETLENVAHLMNLTRERVRQIEGSACAKLADSALQDFRGHDPEEREDHGNHR